MIEAEVKYFARDPDHLRGALEQYTAARHLRYNDQYFNHPRLDFTERDAELRIRQVTAEDGDNRTILTYKSDIVDQATQSKSEHEVDIASSQSETRTLIEAMGFACYIEFEKICQHFEFSLDGRNVAATIVSLNEVTDHFIEIESLVDRHDQVDAELKWLNGFARALGLSDLDQTVITYEGMVAEARSV